MSANVSIDLVGLDFDNIKNNLKNFMRSKAAFKDYDFEGSNISTLVDLLAYNTYLNSFYLNMVASEMFLDSASQRDSVISHAKELNYLPRSYKSAYATLKVDITPSSPNTATVVVPKYTSFTAKVGSNSYSFTTDTSVVLNEPTLGVFSANLVVYEGSVVTDTFVKTSNTGQRFVISNPTVDIGSINLEIIENNGTDVFDYVFAESLYNISANSQVYYLQPAENQQYEIIFGENVLGRTPKEGATIVVTYRACSGELPNGAVNFALDGAIDGQSNVQITTLIRSAGGAVNESIESVRLNAPRTFATQQRAVTASDYEALLKANFSEIASVSVYGGEEVNPPQYGKVFCSVDINDADGVPDNRKRLYKNFLKTKSPLSIDIEIIDPELVYYALDGDVTYDVRSTKKSSSEIRSLVLASIQTYNSQFLNGFNRTLRYSRLIRAIDDADPSIISNKTRIRLVKRMSPITGQAFTDTLSFKQSLETHFDIALRTTSNVTDLTQTSEIHYGQAISSTKFVYNGKTCVFVDDSLGKLYIAEYITYADGITLDQPLISPRQLAGYIDYESGSIVIESITIDSYDGGAIKFFGTPKSKDVTSSQNNILTIDLTETTFNVVGFLA